MTQQSHYWTYTREKHESKWHLNSMFIVAICVSQDMETAQMSINRGMDEEDLYIDGILLSHKRSKIRSFIETWTDLETMTQSEINQKEKSKYHILALKLLVSEK